MNTKIICRKILTNIYEVITKNILVILIYQLFLAIVFPTAINRFLLIGIGILAIIKIWWKK